MVSEQNLLLPSSLLSLATSAEYCRNMCWEGNTIDSPHLYVQHSTGWGWEITGSGVKVSGWTTEATARKPPDFYPTTEAEQEIRRRAAGENIKRKFSFLCCFEESQKQNIKDWNRLTALSFGDVIFIINPRSFGLCSGTWIESFSSPNFHCFFFYFLWKSSNITVQWTPYIHI